MSKMKDKSGMSESKESSNDLSSNWQTICNGSVLCRRQHELPVSGGVPRIAAFDMDGTILRPKDGRKFPSNRQDWEWRFPQVPEKLRSLSQEGYEIVVFTNQKGLKNHGEIAGKLDDVAKALGIRMSAYVALEGNIFRKPCRGMWDLMLDQYCDLIVQRGIDKDTEVVEVIDSAASFYCGDAAGRMLASKKKSDHSDADRGFAANAGVSFLLPEEIFPSSSCSLQWQYNASCPYGLISQLSTSDSTSDSTSGSGSGSTAIDAVRPVDTAEMVLLVGPPACGKTTLANMFAQAGYVWCNNDTLGSKCPTVCSKALKEGKSVVLDNTNRNVETRRSFIKMASDNNIPVRVVLFDISKPLSMHLNIVRDGYSSGSRSRVPDVAIHKFYCDYQPPRINEGVTEVISVKWQVYSNDVYDKQENTMLSGYSADKPRPAPIHGIRQEILRKVDKTKVDRSSREGPYTSDLGLVSQSRTLLDYFYQKLAK